MRRRRSPGRPWDRPGTAELQLGIPSDGDYNQDGPGNAELQLGIPSDAGNRREGPGNAELQLGILPASKKMPP